MRENEAIFHLLNWIDLEEGNRTVDEIVSCSSQSGIVYSRAEMERAAEHCLAAGWIKILSVQDSEEDRLRWQDDPHQNWSEGFYPPGGVDFTPAGWTVFAKMLEEYRNTHPQAPHKSGTRCLWRMPGRVSILSLSEQQLRKELAAVQAGKDELTGGSLSATHKVSESIGPYPIGPWWVKRFVQSPVGYRLDISFSPPDMNF